jgi:hypothetical protein
MQDRSINFSKGGIDAFGDAFTDATGRQDSVDTGITKTTAVFSSNKYTATMPVGSEPFVIIEATSISSVADFAINNCQIAYVSTGKWVLYCTTGTNEVRRAQIMKTLFYGTTGSNPRASSTYITGITALKTTDIRDIGKRAFYSIITYDGVSFSFTYTLTFANTTTNTNCSTWSYVDANAPGAPTASASWTLGGVTLNSVTENVNDELGTDTSADEQDNPTTGVLTISGTGDVDQTTAAAIILCAGGISESHDPSAIGYSTLDFYTTNSIPLFTLASESYSDFESKIVVSIPANSFPSTISSSILVPMIADWEDGADIKYKWTESGVDTDWFSCGKNPSITEFNTITPSSTTLTIKLIPKSSSPTAGYPSIYGFVIRAA